MKDPGLFKDSHILKQILKCPENYEVSQSETERIKYKKSRENSLRKIENGGGRFYMKLLPAKV